MDFDLTGTWDRRRQRTQAQRTQAQRTQAQQSETEIAKFLHSFLCSISDAFSLAAQPPATQQPTSSVVLATARVTTLVGNYFLAQ
jgi:hypothetical protein